jgi:hypothetical protein
MNDHLTHLAESTTPSDPKDLWPVPGLPGDNTDQEGGGNQGGNTPEEGTPPGNNTPEEGTLPGDDTSEDGGVMGQVGENIEQACTEAQASTSSADEGVPVVLAVVPWVLVAILLAAVAALFIKMRGRGGPQAVPVPVQAPPSDLAASPVVPELITLADLITTPAAAVQATRALRTLTVEPVEAEVDGSFSPDIHAAVATRVTTDPAQVNTIAVVHRAGWRSPSGVLRPADVEIWVAASTGEATPPTGVEAGA